MKKIFYLLLVSLTVFSACQNQDWEFPDFEYTTVYFPYQSPVRTIILGEDIFDNSLDNEHKCLIMATMGGVYENQQDITIDVVVDNTLCDSLKFESETGDDVIAMPSNYYTLSEGMEIVIPKGKLMGGIEVHLADAFFEDTLSLKNTYVIPLRILSVANADSVLSGDPAVTDPDRRVVADWVTVPKDYILYAIKYINPWHGNYLRRGADVVQGNDGNTTLDTTYVYHEKYVEWDQVVSISTISLTEASLSLSTRNKGSDTNIPYELILTFDDNNNCSVEGPGSATYAVSGSGQFVMDGDMWGDEERDVLHLQYSIDFGTTTHSFNDTIVMRDRGVSFETFTPVVL